MVKLDATYRGIQEKIRCAAGQYTGGWIMGRKVRSNAHTNGGPKRAGIYVRVSSEKQADKISPETQESDCRDLCERQGYVVVEVYSETEKYRVGRRMVEPSGTRSDRPQLQRMLADVDAGKLDVLVAWREDRLYRGANRARAELSERVKAGAVTIELAKEIYDPTVAAVKAWAAGVELDAKHDRFMMGMAARLAHGNGWISCAYGHCLNKEDARVEADPEEAPWVTAIWKGYADGLEVIQIRRQLIEGGAPQRRHQEGARTPKWNKTVIYRILRNPSYYTGKQVIKWDCKTYEIPVPVLVDAETARRVEERLRASKAHPVRNLKHDYLVSGLAYCAACDLKLGAHTLTHRAGGEVRKTPLAYYRCLRHTDYSSETPEACCRHIQARKLDAAVWGKVWALVSDPVEFERRLSARIEELRAGEADATADCERLQARLDTLTIERQRVINWARQGRITENDLDTQLAGIAIEQTGLERELNEKRLVVGDRAGQMVEFARQYRAHLAEGLVGLNDEPANVEEAHEQFLLRRKFIQSIVARVDVLADQTPVVHTSV